MRWKVTLVAEVESGQSIEHDIASLDRDDRITPATLGLSIAEGKAVLAAIQTQLVGAQAVLGKLSPLFLKGGWEALDPLDRVAEMYQLTKDIRLVRWLCNQAGGFFVANPIANLRKSVEENIFTETRGMVREFSELLDAVTESVEDQPGIDPDEADEIRQRWEDLKACLEKFVVSCEKGHYQLKRKS